MVAHFVVGTAAPSRYWTGRGYGNSWPAADAGIVVKHLLGIDIAIAVNAPVVQGEITRFCGMLAVILLLKMIASLQPDNARITINRKYRGKTMLARRSLPMWWFGGTPGCAGIGGNGHCNIIIVGTSAGLFDQPVRHPERFVDRHHGRKVAPVYEPAGTADYFTLAYPSAAAKHAEFEGMPIGQRLHPTHQYPATGQ